MDDAPTASVVRFLAFLLSVATTSYLVQKQCGSLSSFAPVRAPFQPRPVVYAVAWSLLYVTTGIAWVLAGPKADILLSVVTALACLWLPTYVCFRNKLLSIVVLVGLVVMTIASARILRGASALWLMPLVAWIAFAIYLSVYDHFFPAKIARARS
jgi:tryptophan-rich sensory protein